MVNNGDYEMDLRFSEQHEAFRSELQGFLKANWPLPGDGESLQHEQQEQLFQVESPQSHCTVEVTLRKVDGCASLAKL